MASGKWQASVSTSDDPTIVLWDDRGSRDAAKWSGGGKQPATRRLKRQKEERHWLRQPSGNQVSSLRSASPLLFGAAEVVS